jgi:hypothetical protein
MPRVCGVAATRLTPFVRRSNDEHHGFCPSPWAEVIYSLVAMPHELIRLKPSTHLNPEHAVILSLPSNFDYETAMDDILAQKHGVKRRKYLLA